jgi:ADP-heptose:LPS heptosyltransferase
MTVADMAPLARVADAQFVGVLNWPVPATEGAFAENLKDVSAKLTNLEETAGLLTSLDLVVTVDTAVAHLAGAMGKKVFLLLHDFADFRWTFKDRKSYWYPDVHLFRQQKAGDWAQVIAKVTKGLQAEVESGRRVRAANRV